MSLLNTKVTKEVLRFANRWDLDKLELVNRKFAQIIRIDFSLAPYRLFRKLIIRLINSPKKSHRTKLPCTALYEHQIKEMTFEQVATVFGNPNIRFASTYIAIDADYKNLEYFFDIFRWLQHLWEGKSLVIDMDPHRSYQQLRFFGTLFNDSITTTAGNLAIIDRSYKYTSESEFMPFMYADTSRCREITVASELTLELAESIVDWLHEDVTYKKLTWVFLFGELEVTYQLVEIVAALIGEFEERFWESVKPTPYKFWMLNVFHDGTLPEESFKESTEETLMFEKDIFETKRYQSGLEESAFHAGSVDIKVERTFDDISCSYMASMASDNVCFSSEIISEHEMSF